MTYHVKVSGPYSERSIVSNRASFPTRDEAVRFARAILDDLAAEPAIYGEAPSAEAIHQYDVARGKLDRFEDGHEAFLSLSIDDELALFVRYTAPPAIPAKPENPIVFPGDSEGSGEDAVHTFLVWTGHYWPATGAENPSNWTEYELTTAQLRQLSDQLVRAVAQHTPRRVEARWLRIDDRLPDGRRVISIERQDPGSHVRIRYDDDTLDVLYGGTLVEALA